jgi:hypothetical protein
MVGSEVSPLRRVVRGIVNAPYRAPATPAFLRTVTNAPRPSLGAWLRVAMLGAAASAGALVGFGVRRGAPGALLSAAGERLRGVPSFVAPDRGFGPSAFVGLAHHVVAAVAWGLLFVVLAGRLRGARTWGVALLVAALAVSVDRVLPAPFSLAVGAASLPQRALLALVFAGALAVGMRLAQRDVEGAEPT